jgi:sterol desaturase/sphingolipid hydroxylase (fatty acid hydroxylase superfamily)
MYTFFAMFPHMNIRLELGPLTRVILGLQVHRIHHSVQSEHFNTNFAGAWQAFLWPIYEPANRPPQPNSGPQEDSE